jgi:dipeptidyl aminopeptidase/acylaminoacyl peptidase
MISRPKFLLALALAIVLCVPAAGARQDSPDVARRYTIEQFLKTTNYRGASFSHDMSRLLVSSDATGVYNAWSIELEGGEMMQLTRSDTDSINVIRYFPDDDRFLFTSDQGGNELNHIYVQSDETATDLTPGEKLKAMYLESTGDDSHFFVATNERDQRYFDIYRYDFRTLERELIFENNEGFMPGSISPDGSMIAFHKSTSRDNSDSWLLDVASGEKKLITEHKGNVNYTPAAFTPDGKGLLLLTDEESDVVWLVRHDIGTGERKEVARYSWDIVDAEYSRKGKYLSISINEDGRNVLEVFHAADLSRVDLPVDPGISVNSFLISPDESRAAMYASSDRIPSDLHWLRLGSGDFDKPVRLTRSLNPEIREEDLVSGHVVRFKSFDGLPVPGILYKPHSASADNKVPALVWVHGGPGGQSRIGYSSLIQYLVNNGYAVYAINNRGSSGYGKSFEQLDNRNHGKGDLMDCVSSKTMLADTGYVDPEKIGIIGGSYGGYMTLAALAFKPGEFRIGVDIFGVANWHRTVQSIPPWWEAQRAALEQELGDFSDEEYFKSISPLFHASNIREPLMVLQGANDPRVLKVESDEMVDAVRKNSVPVEYIVFDDEGHGFQKKENQATGYRAILEFCNKHLKGSNN